MADLNIITLEKELRTKFTNIWRCADSYKWHVLKNHNLLAFDWMNLSINYKTIDLNSLKSGQKAIKPWVQQLKKGDLIFVMGKNSFNGIAIARSQYSFQGPELDLGSNGIKPAININYLFKLAEPINHNLKTHNNPTTFAKIDLYNFGLRNVLNFLNDKLPDAIDSLKKHILQMNAFEALLPYRKLIEYKKQIILQGPPGTGKTKLAKEIAQELIFSSDLNNSKELNVKIIKQYMLPGLSLPSSKDKLQYKIEKVTESGVSVIASTGNPYTPTFKEIISSYENRVWDVEGAIKNGNDSYSAAIAKFIYLEQSKRKKDLNNSEQFKLIQFHPSYSYEDFVRGIVAKPNPDGEGVLYEVENKILGKFANLALQNYKESTNQLTENNTKTNLERFISHIIEQLDNTDLDKNEVSKYMLTDKVYIFQVEERRFKYKGDNWDTHPKGLNMNFSQLQKILDLGISTRTDINKELSLNSLTRSHATYYSYLINLFHKFIKKFPNTQKEKASIKNYVLVIDEINRANLSSVLGELINALEYRGEKVESMYEIEDTFNIDGKNELVIPPNLLIIGTMNTADRSVGHIDYAIRRRFAFVDIPPEDLTSQLGDDFKKDLFNKVAALFTEKHLSPEFKSKEVQLGHSYFIQQYEKDDFGKDILTKPYDFKMRLDYEIVPILNEYLSDGVFKNDTDTLLKIKEIKDYQV